MIVKPRSIAYWRETESSESIIENELVCFGKPHAGNQRKLQTPLWFGQRRWLFYRDDQTVRFHQFISSRDTPYSKPKVGFGPAGARGGSRPNDRVWPSVAREGPLQEFIFTARHHPETWNDTVTITATMTTPSMGRLKDERARCRAAREGGCKSCGSTNGDLAQRKS
jgi:hypothetical protein